MITTRRLLALALACCLGALAAPTRAAPGQSLYDLTLETLEGQPFDTASLRGKVVLFVNTASKCGLTPQYEQLEALHRRFKDRGLVLIGVPSNDFGGQEPGSAQEIVEFCQSRFDVTFTLLAKAKVTGEGKAPLYRFLTTSSAAHQGEVSWNFAKFLVDREGRVIGRFAPRVSPDDPALVQAIERALDAGRE